MFQGWQSINDQEFSFEGVALDFRRGDLAVCCVDLPVVFEGAEITQRFWVAARVEISSNVLNNLAVLCMEPATPDALHRAVHRDDQTQMGWICPWGRHGPAFITTSQSLFEAGKRAMNAGWGEAHLWQPLGEQTGSKPNIGGLAPAM